MDLYISPMSCSFAAHVAAREAGVAVELIPVARASKLLPDGRDYRTLVPLANVPALGLADGSVLTESSAVLQYLADQAPERELAPAWGSPERYRLIEWLNFISTELHKKHLWPIFSTRTTPAHKDWSRAHIDPPLAHVERALTGRSFVLGERFTVADCYLFWALLVLPHGQVPLTAYPAITAYVARLQARPAIAAALAHEVPAFRAEAAALAAAAATAATAA